MELLVHPLNRILMVEPGMNLLEALRKNRIPISYSCTSGRCGTCRCKVLRGNVLESGREAKITNPNEDRYVLACTSTLTESCVVEVPEPDEVITHPAWIIKTRVAAIVGETRDIKRLALRPSKPITFSPGQYAIVQFTRNHSRPYSMAGLPDDEMLEFHIRLAPEGRVTGYVARQLQVGDQVRVSGPLGTAYLRRKHEGPMLCAAGGTGLAPVLSIIRGALAEGMRNPIHLYFGVQTPADVYGVRRLAALAEAHANLHVHIVVAMGNVPPTMRRGLVTDAIASDWSSLAGWRVYLCGAPPMVEAASILMKQRGVRSDHIYADAFYASST